MSGAKLVRDKVPDIIRESGAKPVIRIANNDEFVLLLGKKLMEEVMEFLDTNDPHELADVLEVLLALAGVFKIDLEFLREKKANERGRFSKRIVWSGNEPAAELSATRA